MQAGKNYIYFYNGIIPNIIVTKGEYEGLHFSLDGSVVRSEYADGKENHSLESAYTLKKEWKNIPSIQKDGKIITFTSKDKEFLDDLILNFVQEING